MAAMVSTAAPSVATLSPGRVALRRTLRHGSFWAGGGILLVILLAAILAPLLTPHDPTWQDLGRRLVPPVWDTHGSWRHPLGTDQLGRDYLARLIYGGRISLLIGFVTVLISGAIGTALGVAAGYWGALVGNSLTIRMLVIGLLLWDRFTIVTRSATQQMASREFIVAAQAIGSSTGRILLKEILPNITGPLIVVASVELAHAILLEAALSFLGLGVQPPLFTWGLMIAEAKNQLFFRPWLIAIPGAALVALIFAINLLGDAVRDVTAPEGRA